MVVEELQLLIKANTRQLVSEVNKARKSVEHINTSANLTQGKMTRVFNSIGDSIHRMSERAKQSTRVLVDPKAEQDFRLLGREVDKVTEKIKLQKTASMGAGATSGVAAAGAAASGGMALAPLAMAAGFSSVLASVTPVVKKIIDMSDALRIAKTSNDTLSQSVAKAMERSDNSFTAQGRKINETADQIEKLSVEWNKLKDTVVPVLRKSINSALLAIVTTINNILIPAIKKMVEAFSRVGDAAVRMGRKVRNSFRAAKGGFDNFKDAVSRPIFGTAERESETVTRTFRRAGRAARQAGKDVAEAFKEEPIVEVRQEIERASNAFTRFIARHRAASAATRGFYAQMRKDVKGLSPTESLMGKFGDKYTEQLNWVRNGWQTTWTSMADFSKRALMGIAVAVGGTILAAGGMMRLTDDALKTDAAVGTLNMTMGESAEGFVAWAKVSAKEFGLGSSAAIQFGNTYSLLLSSFMKDTGQIAGTTRTLLETSSIVASRTGRTVEDVMERIRSGMLGNTESIEDLGIFVGVNAISMTESFKKMADGKSWEQLDSNVQQQIRLMAILEQSSSRYGTTLQDGPQKKMMQFRAELANFKSALSEAFLPIMITILPILTAFVQKIQLAILVVIEFFKTLFGIKGGSGATSSGASNGIGGAANSATDLAGGLKDSTEKAKKLQNVLAGFDELNVLPEKQTDDVSDTGDSSVGIPGFDSSNGGVNQFADDVKKMNDKIAEMRAKVIAAKEAFEEWIPLLKGLAVLFATVALAAGLFSIIQALFGIDEGIPVIGKLSKKLGAFLAMYAAPILLTFALIAANVAFSENFRKGLKVIWDVVVKVVGGIIKWFKDLGDGMNLSGEVVMTAINALVLAFGIFTGNPIAIAVGAIALAIQGIGYLSRDAVEPVKVLADDISALTKAKVEPLLEEIRALDDSLAGIEFNKNLITDEIVTKIGGQAHAIADRIIKELSSDKNEALANLKPLKDSLGDEMYNNLVAKTNKYYADQEADIKLAEARINEILKKASDEKRTLTEAELAELETLQNTMRDNGIKALSETEVESNKILSRMKSNATSVNLEQASENLKIAIKNREDIITEAESKYDSLITQADRMKEAGIITQAEYDAMVASAEFNRKSEVDTANAKYDEILAATREKLGANAKYIDETTGDIKSKWDMVWDTIVKVFKGDMDDLKATLEDKFGGFGKFLGEFMENTLNMWRNLWKVVKDIWDVFVTVFGPLFAEMWNVLKLIFSLFDSDINKDFGKLTEVLVEIFMSFGKIFFLAWDALFQSLLALVVGIFKAIGLVFLHLLESIGAVFQPFVNIFTTLWKGFWGGIWDFIVLVVAGIGKVIADAWNLMWGLTKTLASNVGSVLSTLWNLAWDNAKTFATNIGGTIGRAWDGIWGGAKDLASDLGNTLSNMWSKAWEGSQNFASNIGRTVSNAWGNIMSSVGDFGSNLVNAWTGIWNSVWDVFGSFGSALAGWWNQYIAPWFSIERWVNMIRNVVQAMRDALKFPKIEFGVSYSDNPEFLAKAAQFLGMPGVPNFDFKMLAKGGIVNSATPFIAGEAGKEVVMPLENNTGWITNLAQMLTERQGNTNNQGAVDVNINFGGSMGQLVRMLKPEIDKENSRRGTAVIQGGGIYD